MRIRYEDLTSLSVIADDGTKHAVSDVLVDRGDLRARHVVLDIGSWFSGRRAMLRMERFGTPEVASGTWPSDIKETDFDKAKVETNAVGDPTGREMPEVRGDRDGSSPFLGGGRLG